jgi:hypothetical protein
MIRGPTLSTIVHSFHEEKSANLQFAVKLSPKFGNQMVRGQTFPSDFKKKGKKIISGQLIRGQLSLRGKLVWRSVGPR